VPRVIGREVYASRVGVMYIFGVCSDYFINADHARKFDVHSSDMPVLAIATGSLATKVSRNLSKA
jgi:hypothetical protein